MTFDVDLANLALTRLAYGDAISSPSEGSKAATIVAAVYDAVRDRILRGHDWSFASARLALADTGSTVAPWAYAYHYPSDCVRARAIYSDAGLPVPFERFGALILTDIMSASLTYTKRVTDLSVWDPQAYSAFAWALAAEIWPGLGVDKAKGQLATQAAVLELTAAKAADAGEGVTPRRDQAASWIIAHWGGGSKA